MGTAEFLRLILPDSGPYVLAVQNPVTGRMAHKTYDAIGSVAEAALHYDKKGGTVYHACCSVRSSEGVWNERKKRKQVRCKANAASVRSQWLDIDVGPDKDFPSRRKALTALRELCAHFKIPAPMIVSSGTGLHCYWTFDADLPAAEFLAYAKHFSRTLLAYGFPHDTKPTRNVVTLLRPIGTTHRKGTPKPVTLVRSSGQLEATKFYNAFGDIELSGSSMNYSDAETVAAMGKWGTGITPESKVHAPSSAKLIAKECAALREFGLHDPDKPALKEDHWRNLLGLLKHTVEGEKLAHRWSQKSDKRYDKAETQDKIDGWEMGPPTCETIESNRPECQNCPHWGKIKSPISLGRSESLPPETKTVVDDEAVRKLADAAAEYHSMNPTEHYLPFWNKHYTWDGENMLAWTKKNDVGDWVPFSSTLYYPFMRYEKDDGSRALLFCALIDPKKNRWRIFEVDTKSVADQRALALELSSQEVTYMKSKQETNQRFVQDILHGLRQSGLETETYSSFGWHDKGFVLGDQCIGSKSTHPVFLSKKIPQELRGDFGVKGTIRGWNEAVSKVYNRKGAEAYQWMICVAAGSILVPLCESDLWHGIPLAAVGEGGSGKTTAAMVGCSIFGNPAKLMVPANAEGTTMNALIQRTDTMRHLPIIMDEITGRKTEEMQALLFALSNGRPKKRLRSDGSEIDFGGGWDMMSFITGNTNMTRMLAESDRLRADASQVRVFEIRFTRKENAALFKDINGKSDIEQSILAEQYGTVGREFIRYVARNKVKVTKQLQRMRKKLSRETNDPRERFQYDMVACTLVAAGILKHIEAIDFDIAALRKWALAHVIKMRKERSEALQTAEDYLQEFIAYLSQHTIITTKFSDAKGRAGLEDVVFEPRFDPHARLATIDRRFIVTKSAFTHWCNRHAQSIDADWLLDRLEKEGFVTPDKRNVRHRITKGTDLKGTRARCIEFVYDKLGDEGVTLPTPDD